MSEEQLNAYCRKSGLYSPQLDQWKKEPIDELEEKGAFQKKSLQIKALEAEIHLIKKQLAHKDKASTVLFLKKKAQEF